MTLSELRKAAGLTQAQAALKIGKHQQDISRWERGIHNPGLKSMWLLAKAYGVPVEAIFTAAGSP